MRTQEEIHEKGFYISSPQQYAKTKIGVKVIEDAILDLGTLKKNTKAANKNYVLEAISTNNLPRMREISDSFYELSGMYQRFCKYLAEIYRYDWYIDVLQENKDKEESKLLKDYYAILTYFDKSQIKRLFNNIALDVMKHGVYYGLLVYLKDKFTIQQLPTDYCRSRIYSGVDPVVEINLRFFDTFFPDSNQRIRALKLFPKDVQRAYILMKQGKLKPDFQGDENCWWPLDADVGIKINLNGSDAPPLINVIPYLIDLDDAQDLDRKKVMQQLLKIIIQKLPFDKNGDLIFDVDEAKDVHNNAVRMLRRAVGIDVLTTFTDVEVADMADKNSATTTDDLQRVERSAFNAAGTSQNLFNTEGNIALEKSVLNDEAYMKDLLYQFRALLNRVSHTFDRKNHYVFMADILETSIYNYTDLSKMYKEQVQIGYSKMLPQIALGHSQSHIIAAALFENNTLHLSNIMIPPLSSNTLSGGGLAELQRTNSSTSDVSAGRPEKDNDEKSEKTIANRAAMGKE